MRNLHRIAATVIAAFAIALASCSTVGPPPTAPPNVQASEAIRERAAQALFGCELLFNGFSVAVDAAVSSGRLTGDNALRVQGVYRRAHDALLAARAAYTLTQYSAVVLRSQEATTAIQSLAPLLGTGGATSPPPT